MVPDTFTSSWEQVRTIVKEKKFIKCFTFQYTESYCWSQDTYFMPFKEDIPVEIPEREDREISYYQWVPFFLIIQAACFRIPNYIWKCCAQLSGKCSVP